MFAPRPHPVFNPAAKLKFVVVMRTLADAYLKYKRCTSQVYDLNKEKAVQETATDKE